MDKLYESKYHKLEAGNWWFVSRRNFIKNLINRLHSDKDIKILEIGCSGGPLLVLLKKDGYGNCFGIDISEEAIRVCKERGMDNARVMDGTRTEFEDNSFDMVIASDILEHVQEDELSLKEWFRILKPGGRLVLFVPAFNFLWSAHDVANIHYRRYSKKMLTERLVKNNFHLERISYWNFALFFPTALIRIIQRFILKGRSKDQLYDLNFIANATLILLLRLENMFLKHADFPVGVSLFAICRK